MVKAVLKLKPIDIAFNIPDIDKASIKVNMPIKITNVLFMIMEFSSFIPGFINDLYMSCVKIVNGPIFLKII